MEHSSQSIIAVSQLTDIVDCLEKNSGLAILALPIAPKSGYEAVNLIEPILDEIASFLF